ADTQPSQWSNCQPETGTAVSVRLTPKYSVMRQPPPRGLLNRQVEPAPTTVGAQVVKLEFVGCVPTVTCSAHGTPPVIDPAPVTVGVAVIWLACAGAAMASASPIATMTAPTRDPKSPNPIVVALPPSVRPWLGLNVRSG